MGECHLLRAKLNFARHNILGCLEYLAKSYECGDRYKESQRRRCEIFFYRCLCLIQQGNKKEAYDAWKTSHKCLDHIKDVKEMQNLKDKLNIAMMRCYD